jgi:GNAT superfamily N-acetyltransferase
MAELTVRIVEAAHSRELRRSVLRPQFAPGSMLPGDDEPGSVHLGAFDGSTLVSACAVFPQSCPWQPGRPAWRLRSMATEPTARGTGAGSAVLRSAAGVARGHGAEVLWCQARVPAVGFYLRCGWQLHGELFHTDYGPHRYMWTELSGTG